jgi:hypothetical protein
VSYALFAAQVALLVVAASFAFDCIHWMLHRCAHARSRWLRAVASLHGVHHAFWDRELRFHEELAWKNIGLHHVPELGTQLAVCSAFFWVFRPAPVLVTMGFLCTLFVVVVVQRGKDVNHRPLEVVPPPPRMGLTVNLAYHAQHHRFPDRYFSSYVLLFDWIFGTGCQIAGRRFAMAGVPGAFGAELKRLLELEGAATVTPLGEDSAEVEAVLKETDVLITSSMELDERFKRATMDRRFAVEVWMMGSKIQRTTPRIALFLIRRGWSRL